jgi:histidine triad (HIT) family protein
VTSKGCPFCLRIERGEYEAFVPPERQPSVVWFEPLNPVTPGHMLFVPATHVTGASDPSRNGPYAAGLAVEHAARWAQQHGVWSYNLITSVGTEATQSVFHLHVHLVPRREDDGLLVVPWTGQHKRLRPVAEAEEDEDAR